MHLTDPWLTSSWVPASQREVHIQRESFHLGEIVAVYCLRLFWVHGFEKEGKGDYIIWGKNRSCRSSDFRWLSLLFRRITRKRGSCTCKQQHKSAPYPCLATTPPTWRGRQGWRTSSSWESQCPASRSRPPERRQQGSENHLCLQTKRFLWQKTPNN